MNTHDIDIELPPLPTPPSLIQRKDWYGAIQAYARSYGMECARAAIEADRKRSGEPVAYLRAENLVRLAQPHVAGCAASIQKEPADGFIPIFTAPQPAESSRGEPVGYVMPTAIKQLKAGGNAIVGGVSQGGDVAVYLAPQPAEPDLAKCAECGAEMIHVRPGKWQHPDCPQSPWAAEPVKHHLKVSYDDKGDCLYVVCDSNDPADAEEDDKGILYRRAISDGRLVGITIMNFMGRHAESSDDAPQPAEPVKLECPKCGADRAKEPCAGNLMNCAFKGEAHAAEPVKVPSEDGGET